MTEEKSAYRQVLKATSLFGGVQVFNILVSVARSKIISLLLGPYGMGINALLLSAVNVMNEITNLGLERSAVRDVSESAHKDDRSKSATTIAIVKKLIWVTGVAGVIATIVFSPLLSKLAFGNYNYTWAFIWISITLLFRQLTSGNLVILQGFRKLQYLAKANVIGSVAALLIAIPLYYFLKIDGIVPAIIATFALTFIISSFYAKKVVVSTQKISISDAFSQGRGMIKLGISLSLSSLLSVLSIYALQIFIRHQSGEVEVGFYAAAVVIINSYVGVVFNAMATDYFPRLAAVHHDISLLKKTVSQQALVAILLITPIIILFLTFPNLIVKILYTPEFLVIIGLLSWGILGTLFKALSFTMGYIILAKGHSKVFVKTAIIFNVLQLTLNILGYLYGGLTGLGISFLVYYIIHYLSITMLTKYLYDFYFPVAFYKLFALCSILCGIAFLATYFIEDMLYRRVFLITLFAISVVITVYQFNKKMELKELVSKILKRKSPKK